MKNFLDKLGDVMVSVGAITTKSEDDYALDAGFKIVNKEAYSLWRKSEVSARYFFFFLGAVVSMFFFMIVTVLL